MNHTLRMSILKVEGAMIRLLGLVERRGFSVTAMDARAVDAGDEVEITMEIHSGGRSVETLTRQIAKLYDVRRVACLASEPAMVMRESVAC